MFVYVLVIKHLYAHCRHVFTKLCPSISVCNVTLNHSEYVQQKAKQDISSETLLLLMLLLLKSCTFPREHLFDVIVCYLLACLQRFCIETPHMLGEEIDEYVHAIASFVSLASLYKSDNV